MDFKVLITQGTFSAVDTFLQFSEVDEVILN